MLPVVDAELQQEAGDRWDTSARGLKPWHRPKLQLAVELIKQGFERGAPQCALEDGAPLIFSKSWAMPTMYFVALVCRREIWETAAVSMPHDKTDNFYRCLIFLDGTATLRIVEQITARATLGSKSSLSTRTWMTMARTAALRQEK